MRLTVLPGTVFGRLTVVGEAAPHINPDGGPRRKMQCECQCGNTVAVTLKNLRNGNTTSCGCFRGEVVSTLHVTHGACRLGHKGYVYNTWIGIKRRCYNANCKSYPWYGARGIAVHSTWVSDYAAFAVYVRETLGERPKGHTLDWIDNNRGYEPGNLRWATMSQQNWNRRSNLSAKQVVVRAPAAQP